MSVSDAPTIVIRDQEGSSLRLDERHLRVRGLPTQFEISMSKRAFADGAIQTGDRSMQARRVTLEGWVVGDDQVDHMDRLGELVQLLRQPDVDLIVGGNTRIRLAALESVDPSLLAGTGMRASRVSLDLAAADPAVYHHDERLTWQFDHSDVWSEGLANLYPEDGHVVTIRESSLAGALAAAVDEGTTNLLTDNAASIETSAAGWTAGSGVTATRVTTAAKHGSASLQVVTDGGGADQGVFAAIDPGAGSAGKTYAASVYLQAVSASVDLQVWLRDETNTADGAPAPRTITPADGWVRVVALITLGGSDSSDLRLHVATDGTAAKTWLLDAAQVEERGFATSFTLGTRAAGALAYSLATLPLESPPEEWVLFLRVAPAISWDDTTTENGSADPLKEVLVTWGAEGERGLELAVDRDAQEIVLTLWPSEELTWSYTGALVGTGALSLAVVYLDGDVSLYTSGVLRDSVEGGDLEGPELTDLLQIGSAGGDPPNHRINEMLLSWDADDEESIPTWNNEGIPDAGGCQAWVFDLAGAEEDAVAFELPVQLYGRVWPVVLIENGAEGNPDLTLTNTSDPTASLPGGRQFRYRDTAFLAGQEVEVDSRYGTVVRDESVSGVRWVSGSYPQLVAGVNDMEYLGADARLTFLFTGRWL